MSKKKPCLFKLPGVKPDEIDKQYAFKTMHNTLLLSEKYIPHQSTKISDLQHFSQNLTVVDELKNTHNAKLSTVLSNTARCNCFWDHHAITDSQTPIYCPIEKRHAPRIKNYVSHINGKPYKIQDSIQPTDAEEYYVDGVFCSVECCLAFIECNQHDPLYQISEYYLREIYALKDHKSAPHWRLLTAYGGNMSIDEFRQSFANTTYTPDGVVYNPICFLFRENYHL
jgi:hypothetical protein